MISAYSHANNYDEIGIPVTEIFNPNSHKGTGQNWWLVQGENGFIYNGTGSGLSEWDGERWRLYPTPNKSRIRSLSKWKDGRLYVGTTNDIGYYDANQQGSLTYYSLLADWSFEQRQFGEVWSVAANQHGVVFVTPKMVLFWNGHEVKIIQDAKAGVHRVFALKDSFIYKSKGDAALYRISSDLDVKKTQWRLPEAAVTRLVTTNRDNKLVAFTSHHGIYSQGNDNMELRIESQSFGLNVHVYHGMQAKDGYYYVATLDHGLFIVTEDFQLVRQYTDEHQIGSNEIYSVIEDVQGNIWLSGAPNIVKMIPPHRYSRYQTQQKIPLTNKIALLQNKITVAAHGLHQIHLPKEPLAPPYFIKIPYINGSVWDFLEYQGRLFYAGEGGVFVRKINQEIISEKAHKLGDSINGRALFIDPLTNILFAATEDGIITIEFNNEQWQVRPVSDLEDDLRELTIDDKGIVWAGTETQELYRVENAQFPDKETKIQKFVDVDGLGPNNVVPYKLTTGMVIGTNDGLMDYQHDRQPPLKFVSGYPDIFKLEGQEIHRLYEDESRRIWYRIGTHTGYIEKDSQGKWQLNEAVFKAFTERDYKGFVMTARNMLWFVSSQGDIYRVNLDLTKEPPPPGVLNIRQVTNLDNDEELSGGLNKFGMPQLTENNNSIRIQYALAENANANPAKYRHKLIGNKNEKWSKWLSETHKDFTNLAGSDYRFMLEAKDGWGRVSSTDLVFSVLPPWYLSKIAWLIYLITLIILLVLSGWITQRWRTAKLQQRNELLEKKITLGISEVKQKSEQLQQQQILKDRFFSNVSHEFRTPLTLTIMPLQDLLRTHPDLDHDISFPVEAALRNSQKVLELVGQVLDINRLELGQFPLHIAEYDITDLINRIVSRFTPWAEQHHQKISSYGTSDPIMIFCDQDQIEKCISNLISNAIKYSGEGSQISIGLENDEVLGRVGIKVSDNGQGISKQSEQKVFDRFFQDQQSEQITEPGTGIGLSLVKELITLHHGEVELINIPGEGCTFILWLVRGSDHFEQLNEIEPVDSANPSNMSEALAPIQQMPPIEESFDLPQKITQQKGSKDDQLKHQDSDITTLLIVDDNSELRHFVALRLSSYYRIIEASNGQEGLARAKSELPDLIISDVMMPIKNGLEMTQAIRANRDTSTIPIILLTAKSSKRETVDGLQTGADDYLTKPFDTSELIVRVAGLIKSRKTLRKKIEAELLKTKIHGDSSQPFSKKLRSEIVSQITKSDFSIDNIASALALSRRSLNRKCQQELDQSVGNFVTEVRMQNALSLLSESNHNVSEVAYAVGYESLAYFSRSFKKFYGKSPSEVNNSPS